MESVSPAALRFAVLWHHQIDEPHFDLLLETRPGSDLATWRSPVWPITDRTEITRLKDHRRIYLNYDGEISGGRGRVDRISDGTCNVTINPGGEWTVELIESSIKLLLAPVNADTWEAWSVG